MLDDRSLAKRRYETLGVLLQLFGLDFLVSIQMVDPSIELLNYLLSFLRLERSVVMQVLQQYMGIQLVEGRRKDV